MHVRPTPMDGCMQSANMNIRSFLARTRRTAARLMGAGARPSAPSDPMAENRRILENQSEKAQAAGIDRLMVWLSFDCDTDRDAEAAERIDPWLRERGIHGTYAVPGVQIERSAENYRRLAAAGASFMNHGYQPHAEWRGDRYHPITFYDQMAEADVVEDIRLGHEAVKRVVGIAPRGFRAPHFGSFQSPEQLALVHREAVRLGYFYSSTTVPQFGLDHGPMAQVGGLYEFALSGSLRAPTLILDSWCHLEDRAQYRLADAYCEMLVETVEFMLSRNLPGLLSLYVDPAHVDKQAPFLRAMDFLHRKNIVSVRPEDLLPYDGSPRLVDTPVWN